MATSLLKSNGKGVWVADQSLQLWLASLVVEANRAYMNERQRELASIWSLQACIDGAGAVNPCLDAVRDAGEQQWALTCSADALAFLRARTYFDIPTLEEWVIAGRRVAPPGFSAMVPTGNVAAVGSYWEAANSSGQCMVW